ncbi:MAG: ABC transporter substrate-binding protein [Bifidobacteriaceae bacterium]|jgi:polar amino acid transport system substrate-binding protein|nr:ABC transporter substrate-binding protein [Bifidobacteriaceae bacterium]
MEGRTGRWRGRRAALLTAAWLGLMGAIGGCSQPMEVVRLEPTRSSAPDLPTVVAGQLTVATAEQATEPWIEDNDPTSQRGFEAAVVYAVAGRLGFPPSAVTWVRIPFNEALTTGAKEWDIAVQQYSITTERRALVDFSSSYYTTAKAVVTYIGSPADGATSVEQLKDVRFGVEKGTTSANVVESVIAPATPITVYASREELVAALDSRQIDALVTDLPRAVYMANYAVYGGLVVGQLSPQTGAAKEQLAFVLPKGSGLTAAVSEAIEELRDQGKLSELASLWMHDYQTAPVMY